MGLLFFGQLRANAQDGIQISPQLVDSVQQLKAFEYANDPAYWTVEEAAEEEEDTNSWLDAFLNFGIPKMLMYLFVIGLIIFIIVRLLADQNMSVFVRKPKRHKKHKHLEEVAHEPGIEELLLRAEATQDFREAVRLQYISLLYLMRDKQLVEYNPQWTNNTYLRLFKGHPGIGTFKQLTRIYEFVYYGGFDTDRSKYQQISEEFSKFRKIL